MCSILAKIKNLPKYHSTWFDDEGNLSNIQQTVTVAAIMNSMLGIILKCVLVTFA